MTLTTGTKLGTYEIVGPLGAGGMGEVYRARDAKLKREVALKVLPDALSRDGERLQRFQREAEVLASLNHPHIAAIHELAEFGESRFLVLELVEGETLAERLARGPVPIDEALEIASQILLALEAAHDKGIVHRDLKPANIKQTRDGTDFGLAKVREGGDGQSLSSSPTMMTAATGIIMGTAAYMSPEQAKGKEVDRRSDVWAFGCVLYELLTGRAVFGGETVGEVLGAIFRAEPDWSRLPAETPESIRRLLRRCLQKDRKLRLRDCGDARIEIEDAKTGSRASEVPRASRRREWLAWASAAAFALVAVLAIAWALRPAPPARELRLDIATPPTTDPISLAISPDGQKLVFAATSDGRTGLWVRSLDSASAKPLAGTDYATFPFWSPDSRSVGFFADSKLKRIDVDGGFVQTLATVAAGRGGAWSPEGVIVFAPTGVGTIFRIPAAGGEMVAMTQLQRPEQFNHRFPQFLPDGRHFLFYVQGTPDAGGVYVGRIDGSETRRLTNADAAAVYSSSGHLLFVRQGTLFAQDFAPDRLTLTGSPFRVSERIAVHARSFVAALSASAAGPIVYRTGSSGMQRQFVWLDRSGAELGKVGEPDNAEPTSPSLSPDGRRVAMYRTVNGELAAALRRRAADRGPAAIVRRPRPQQVAVATRQDRSRAEGAVVIQRGRWAMHCGRLPGDSSRASSPEVLA
jgi:eukaryotic-like serine/threonine-protein kinase